MTKFYIVGDDRGVVLTCVTSKAEAKRTLREHIRIYQQAGRRAGGTIEMVDVPVTSESVRRLLGGCGGYATNSEVVVEIDPL